MYLSTTYQQLWNRISDWLRVSNAGGNVGDRSNDLLNRGQEALTMYRAWNDMLRDEPLTVVDNIAELPADMARIIDVYYDTDLDGKKEGGWYHRGPRNKGFKILVTGNNTDGFTRKIQFYNTMGQTAMLRYQKKLDDFTAQVDTPQYSFFPGELLIRQAQQIHIVETGLTGAEMAVIERDYKVQLDRYAAAHDWYQVQLRRKPLDNEGQEIYLPNINLSGNGSYGPSSRDGLSNSYDRHR